MPSGADTDSFDGIRSPFINDENSSYDALAELFLGEDQPPGAGGFLDDPERPAPGRPEAVSERVTPIEAPRRTIEALVLGHLPGMASPWASQYAAAVAERSRSPVALLRLCDEEATLDVIGERLGDLERRPDLRSALDLALSRASRILLRVDAVHEPVIASSPSIDEITVLTGADEAAIVSAYRTIKGMAGQRSSESPARINASIMGAAPEDAARAHENLQRAVAAFLDDTLHQAPSIHRIAPVARITLCRAPHREGVHHLLELLTTADATSRDEPRSTGADAMRSTTASPSPHGEPERPERSRMTDASAGPARGALTRRLVGLTPLPIRCPYEESVELAIDETNGRLNLLALSAPDVMSQLVAAASWARDHADLLTRAEPSLRRPEAPRLHVFTDDPAAAGRLLASDVHIHLLARPNTADGMVCMALNDPK